MKLGLGLGVPVITRDTMHYARHLRVTHLVLHLTKFSQGSDRLPAAFKGTAGYTGTPAWFTSPPFTRKCLTWCPRPTAKPSYALEPWQR